MTSFRQLMQDLSRAQGPLPLLLAAGRYAIEHIAETEQVMAVLETLARELSDAARKRANALADLAEDAKFGAEP